MMCPSQLLLAVCFAWVSRINAISFSYGVRIFSVEPILRFFPKCNVLFYVPQVPFDYATIQSPFQLTNRSSSAIDSLKVLQKLQHVRCALSIVVEVQSDEYENNRGTMQSLLSFTRSIPHGSFDRFLLILIGPAAGDKPFLKHELLFVDSFLDPENLIPFFLLFYKPASPNAFEEDVSSGFILLEAYKGSFLCWYCLKSLSRSDLLRLRIHEFNFECEEPWCAQVMMQTYTSTIDGGRDVQWNFHAELWYATFETSTYVESPFGTSQQHSEALPRQALFNFISKKVNISESNNFAKLNELPSIIYVEIREYFEHKAVYLSGYYHTFNFITSDGAQKTTSPLRSLLASFNWQVWVLISILPVLLVAFSQALAFFVSNAAPFYYSKLWNVLLAFYMVLIDQVGLPKQRSSALRMIGVSWILGVFLITQFYRANLQYEYIIDSFTVQWERLEQLENFTLYVPGESGLAQDLNSNPSEDYYSNFLDLQSICLMLCRRGCEFSRYLHMYQLISPPEESYKIWSALMKVRVFDMFKVRELAFESLSKPKSALVIQSSEFNQYWNEFKKIMIADTSFTFYHNQHISDPWAAIPMSFYSSDLNSYHKQGVPFAMRAVFSSGLYDLWMRWHRLHSGIKPETQALQDSSSKAMSFDSPTVSGVFHVMVLCWASSMLFFVAEIMRRTTLVQRIVNVFCGYRRESGMGRYK